MHTEAHSLMFHLFCADYKRVELDWVLKIYDCSLILFLNLSQTRTHNQIILHVHLLIFLLNKLKLIHKLLD